MSDEQDPRSELPEPVAALEDVEQTSRVGRRHSLQPDEATIRIVSALAQIQCTHAEAASVLGVARNTFEAFLRDHEQALVAWNDGKGIGRMSLRRRQFKLTDRSAIMAIHLGKQKAWLGQTDRQEHSGPGGGGIPVNIGGMSSAQLAHLLGRIDAELALQGEGGDRPGAGTEEPEGDGWAPEGD